MEKKMSDTKRLGDFSDFLGFTKRNNPDLHQRLNKIGRKPFSVKRTVSRDLYGPKRDMANASRENKKPES